MTSKWRLDHPVAMQLSNFELDAEGKGCLGVDPEDRYEFCYPVRKISNPFLYIFVYI